MLIPVKIEFYYGHKFNQKGIQQNNIKHLGSERVLILVVRKTFHLFTTKYFNHNECSGFLFSFICIYIMINV